MTSPDGPRHAQTRPTRGSAASGRSVASTRSGGSGGSGTPPRKRGGGTGGRRRPDARTFRRRRILAATLSVFLVFAIWLTISLGSALTDPSLGTSSSARFAEWGRANHLGGLVTWLEQEWYALNPPKKGGKPPANAFGHHGSTSTSVPSSCAGALTPPATVLSPATPAQFGEGAWAPVARQSAGCSAVYTSFVRPDAIHTSYVAGLVWMDPKLVSFTLYSGSQIPGGGPFQYTAPIKPLAAMSLVSAFNAGFRMSDSQGGYFTDGRLIVPLRTGAASAVIYRDGTMNVGAWGSDVSMSSSVVSVRQNLDLIVADGRPALGLSSADNRRWGATLGGAATVWRSGMGVTSNGAIVYVGGPAMSITALADLLIRAGCIRAMELDINTDWVQYSYYTPALGQLASPANGKPLLANMAAGASGPGRYFATWWTRDFFTASARFAANGTMTTPRVTTTTRATKK